MKVTVLAFGIVKDIFKGPSAVTDIPAGSTTAELKVLLEYQYPLLKQLASYMVAVNNEYASMNDILQQNDEIAIIPPVSGG